MGNISKVLISLEFDELLNEDELYEALEYAIYSFKEGFNRIISQGSISQGIIEIKTEE